MDFFEKTKQYYSKWLRNDDILHSCFNQVEFIYSEERNKIQEGYGQQFDLYIFSQADKMVFSYGDRALYKIDEIKSQIQFVVSIPYLKRVLKQFWRDNKMTHNVKYVYNKIPEKTLISRPLHIGEYHQYYEFFIKNNPACKNTDWLNEYYLNMVKGHLCCGVFINEMLVSCTDAPDIPYMQNEIQEIGVNTLEGYRGYGYATDACITCIKEIIKNGKCPQWSTTIDNIASQKLAEKAGFTKYADVITITL